MHRNADIDSRQIRVPWGELFVGASRAARKGLEKKQGELGCVTTDHQETMCHSSIIVSECVGGPGPDATRDDGTTAASSPRMHDVSGTSEALKHGWGLVAKWRTPTTR